MSRFTSNLFESDPCDLFDTVRFNTDSTVTSSFYEENTNGDCTLSVDEVDTGIWGNTENSGYTFIYDEKTRTSEINFSRNTFSIEFSDTFDGQTIDYKDVCTRI